MLDTTAPTTTVSSALFSADTGVSATDLITSAAAQTVSGTLSAVTVTGETVYVSLDAGSHWSAATNTIGSSSWSLAGQTLTASNTLQVKVTDVAGNDGTVYSHAYVYNNEAPVFSSPNTALALDQAGHGVAAGATVYDANANDTGAAADPFLRQYAWHHPWPLDLVAMRRAAKVIIGRHDFTALSANPMRVIDTPVRTVARLTIRRQGQLLMITVSATGFLYKMVRSIAGALVKVGEGRLSGAQLRELLAGKRRTALVETAPARGLFLWRVRY